MIDLNKSQIVNPMVEAWGRDEDNEEWQKGLLAAIDHDDVVPYLLIFNNGNNSYRQCTLTDPYAKKTRLIMEEKMEKCCMGCVKDFKTCGSDTFTTDKNDDFDWCVDFEGVKCQMKE